MTSRATLQEKSLDELRVIAASLGVPDHDTLQKSKLITAIIGTDGFEGSAEPAQIELPAIEEVRSADGEGRPAGFAPPEGEEEAEEGEPRDGEESGEERWEGGQRGRRRRRRGGGERREPFYEESELEVREGILDVLPESYGFLRVTGYLPGDRDVYVAANQIRKFGLRKGDVIAGPVRPPRTQEKFPALVRLDHVNGMTVDAARDRPKFGDLTPLFPDQRLRLEVEGQPNHVLARIVDLIAPIGKGQRGLIVSPPKAGKTTVLKEIANSITHNNPECKLIVVLVDERPEEVTDMQRSVKGDVVFSTFDRPAEEHTQVAELAIERAKRLVEMQQDVVILLDSITRLARAYNLATPASGRILSGGVDS
ncbi:MAG: transcription termination factor Rho, partial [Actinobacteria bacterium]|nr:transcription termination factor Rho [Actinomycetota bacterium]